jgi:hypothetical protein
MLIAAALVWAAEVRATTVVVLRSADGTALSVAADSLRTAIGPPGTPAMSACKITRISPNVWVALAGVNDPGDDYYPDQIAMGAGLLHRDDLDAIVEAFRERASELVPLVMTRIRASVIQESWEKDFEGWPTTQAVFFGLVNGRPVFQLIELTAHATCSGFSVSERSGRCPGNCRTGGPLAAPGKQMSVYLWLVRRIGQTLGESSHGPFKRDIPRAETCRNREDVTHID